MTLNGGYLSEDEEKLLSELRKTAHVLQECCKKKTITQALSSNNPRIIRSLVAVLWLDFNIDVGDLLVIKGQLQTLKTNAVKAKMPTQQFYLRNITALCRIVHLLNYASCFSRYIYRPYFLKRVSLKQCETAIDLNKETYVELLINTLIANLDVVAREADSILLKQILTLSFNFLTTCDSSTMAERF